MQMKTVLAYSVAAIALLVAPDVMASTGTPLDGASTTGVTALKGVGWTVGAAGLVVTFLGLAAQRGAQALWGGGAAVAGGVGAYNADTIMGMFGQSAPYDAVIPAVHAATQIIGQ